MKRCANPVVMLLVLISSFGFGLVIKTKAQNFATVHLFASIGGDGFHPTIGPILWDGTLYGTTMSGGTSADGVVYKGSLDGSDFVTLHSFSACIAIGSTNADGIWPSSILTLSGSSLFGTASRGGGGGSGSIFAVETNGSNFRVLYSFTAVVLGFRELTNVDGAGPVGSLIITNNAVYGVTTTGGIWGKGTVFAIDLDGSNFRVLHYFAETAWPGLYINSGGMFPSGALVLHRGMLYGTATQGGTLGGGTVFKLNLDGSGFDTVCNLGDGGGNALVIRDSTVYSTSSHAVFKVSVDGTGFAVLHNFNGNDGFSPEGLLLLGRTLYGTAAGGSLTNGTLFQLNIDGTGFAVLHNFVPFGPGPCPGLVFADNRLYGGLRGVGIGNIGQEGGSIYSLSVQPELSAVYTGGQMTLSWPTNFSGFSLESTPNLDSPTWSTVSTPPGTTNDLNIVTNPTSGHPQFFRLAQ